MLRNLFREVFLYAVYYAVKREELFRIPRVEEMFVSRELRYVVIADKFQQGYNL